MLIQYRLTQLARRRQFLESLPESESQMIETDVSKLPNDIQDALRRLGRAKSNEQSIAYLSATDRMCIVLRGEYNALTLEELVRELRAMQHDTVVNTPLPRIVP
jgi:hypothetical protein